MINFTDCQIDTTATYGGSDQKRGIFYEGKRYMLKLSDRINTEKRNNLNSSYSNSVYSEYICCHILNSLGFNAQNTLLGYLDFKDGNGNIERKPVVACENFVQEGEKLVEFKDIEGALLSHKPPKVPTIEDIYEILSKESNYFDKSFANKALEQYWDSFILDAFMGNFDRHANNWGYLVQESMAGCQITQFAPIYDCGSCLYPQLADDSLLDILSSEEEISMRIDKFPNSALDVGGKKANYKEYISSLQNEDCTKALFRVFPKIDMNVVNDVIDKTEGISYTRKTFYKTILQERYDRILDYSYQKARLTHIVGKMPDFLKSHNSNLEEEYDR